ncbi:uncharacterized protein BO88DRAFT_408605 [Aspergillus vadensis CBS 113365]|uniref:Uncharacterized protein n=1 Tax=Aspergillus vadensis (strain CBS 113365 / IMI 142717 / IBT 24658) TaxID=1448311 RepID=A0A319BLN3_ASPVC|nr:hypothetical protein BO88DRAFT_408605 [Aspergillus vadensis CBS 113365]PYH64178.1 hypothetical protein BO88DRAFT_408605 [Aspergillus vadensis CBS 113365]
MEAFEPVVHVVVFWAKLFSTFAKLSKSHWPLVARSCTTQSNAWNSSWQTLLDYDTLIPKVVPRRRQQEEV